YVVTTAQADGGGTVECRPNQWPALSTKERAALESARIDLDRVLLPPRTWQRELKMSERHARTLEAARGLGINRIVGSGEVAPLGFVVTGMAGPYLRHVLADIGLDGV